MDYRDRNIEKYQANKTKLECLCQCIADLLQSISTFFMFSDLMDIPKKAVFVVKRYAESNVKIRPYAVRKLKMKQYTVRKWGGGASSPSEST